MNFSQNEVNVQEFSHPERPLPMPVISTCLSLSHAVTHQLLAWKQDDCNGLCMTREKRMDVSKPNITDIVYIHFPKSSFSQLLLERLHRETGRLVTRVELQFTQRCPSQTPLPSFRVYSCWGVVRNCVFSSPIPATCMLYVMGININIDHAHIHQKTAWIEQAGVQQAMKSKIHHYVCTITSSQHLFKMNASIRMDTAFIIVIFRNLS